MILTGSDLCFEPQKIIADFKDELILELMKQFPRSAIRGSFYDHLNQVWRAVKALGALRSYRSSKIAKSVIRRLACLSIIPVVSIPTSFSELEKEVPSEIYPEVNLLLKYYKTKWLEGCIPLINWNSSQEDFLINGAVEIYFEKIDQGYGINYFNIDRLISTFEEIDDKSYGSWAQLYPPNLDTIDRHEYIGVEVENLKEEFQRGLLNSKEFLNKVSRFIHRSLLI